MVYNYICTCLDDRTKHHQPRVYTIIYVHDAWMTAPNTTCFPSSHDVLTVHRKNCEPLVPGPALAMERMPAIAQLSEARTSSDITIKVGARVLMPTCMHSANAIHMRAQTGTYTDIRWHPALCASGQSFRPQTATRPIVSEGRSVAHTSLSPSPRRCSYRPYRCR